MRATALLTLLMMPLGTAQTPPEQAKSKSAALDPLNRLSPQSSVIAFLDLCRTGNFERAARYIDLRKLALDQRVKQGGNLARDLAEILNRDADFDVADLSRDPEGDLSDGLPPDRERVVSYGASGKKLEVQLARISRGSGLTVWMFAGDSVDLIPQLLQATSDSFFEPYLPAPLIRWSVWSTPLWRWIALALLIAVVVTLSGAFMKLALFLLGPISRRVAPRAGSDLLASMAGPLRLLLVVGMIRGGSASVAPSAIVRVYFDRILELLMWVGIAWLLMRITDLGVARTRALLEVRHSTFSRSGLPLASRMVKATVIMLAVTAILSSWGYNTTTILAGLGIGGVAVALAAQKTIENLFGGVAVISDRPVGVGDFCKFGERVGTVEDVGLRSTRIRTLDRTLVTVPNSEFSSMVLENFSRRDKIWFHPVLNLRRDSAPDQVRAVLDSVGLILEDHSQVETGRVPVRFVGVGSYSLDIEIFAYILTPDYDEFLRVQQELLLRIMDAVVAAGTALALPTQASISYSVSERRKPEHPIDATERGPLPWAHS